MSKTYIKPIWSSAIAGSIGLTIIASLQGCGGDQPPEPPKAKDVGTISDATQNKEQGVFLVIQQTGTNPDTYELKEKYPADQTRAILKDTNGNERLLTEAELKKIADEEAKKVEAGTSTLTQPAAENQGLSLGETLLASAAGALVGGMIANKLMGNSNYQQHQQYQQRHTTPSSLSRSIGNTTDTRAVNPGQTQPKSGFFGSNSSSTTPSSSSHSSSGSSSSSSSSYGG